MPVEPRNVARGRCQLCRPPQRRLGYPAQALRRDLGTVTVEHLRQFAPGMHHMIQFGDRVLEALVDFFNLGDARGVACKASNATR